LCRAIFRGNDWHLNRAKKAVNRIQPFWFTTFFIGTPTFDLLATQSQNATQPGTQGLLLMNNPAQWLRRDRPHPASTFLSRSNRSLFPASLLIPTPCLLCGCTLTRQDRNYLCHQCLGSLPRLDSHRCECCCLPLLTPAPLCGECLDKPPAFSRAAIPFTYIYPLDFLILEFKYRHHLASGRCLSELLLGHIQQELASGAISRPDMLVPVPLHWWRQWRRGFNQAEILAHHLGKALDIPRLDTCQRKHQPRSQKGLGRRARQANLRNIFRLKPGVQNSIRGKHITLVDDVITTGATARTLSELLIRAGARRVDIWALARTPAAASDSRP
jgi:ComF family protein